VGTNGPPAETSKLEDKENLLDIAKALLNLAEETAKLGTAARGHAIN